EGLTAEKFHKLIYTLVQKCFPVSNCLLCGKISMILLPAEINHDKISRDLNTYVFCLNKNT
ncbi:MAG: hypothetical protein ACXWEY_14410, partial [Bacteroidia bacterium]